MTQELKQGWSYECGGSNALDQSELAPIVGITPPPEHVGETYTGKLTWKLKAIPKAYALVGTPWITCVANVRFSDITPTADVNFMRFDDGVNDCWFLRLRQDPYAGALALRDANGDPTVWKTWVFEADTWYTISVKFKHSNSTDIEVWVDDTLVLSDTGFDASHGGSTGLLYMMQNVEGEEFFNTHGLVIEDDGTLMHDEPTVGRVHYFRDYQAPIQGASGDFGDDLHNGTLWSDAGKTPYDDVDYAEWDVGPLPPLHTSRSGGIHTNDAVRYGPKNDPAIAGGDQVMGAIYVARCRSKDNFPLNRRVKFTMHYGSDDSYGSTAWPLALPGVWNLNSNRQKLLDGADPHCATKSEHALIGAKAEQNGAQGALWIGELWALYCFREPEAEVAEQIGVVHAGMIDGG